MKSRTWIILVLLLSFFSRLILFLQHVSLWWDSYVYIAMAKYLVTLGHSGIWESLRPPLLPLFLTLGSMLNIPLFFGYFLQILLSLGSIYLLFLITKYYFTEKEAILATILFSFSGIFFFLTAQIYTEILALFFILLGLYLFIRNFLFFSGISISLAFLAKYPSGIFFLVLGCSLLTYLFQTKKTKLFLYHLFSFACGAAIVLIPYFFSNILLYGGALNPIFEASIVIKEALGCNIIHAQPWYFYFSSLFLSQPFLIFLFFTLPLFKKPQKKIYIIFFSFIFPFIYFSSLACKDHRYTLFFLPFLCIIAAYGLCSLFKKRSSTLFTVVIIISILTSFLFSFTLIIPTRNHFEDEAMETLALQSPFQVIITTHPRVAFVRDEPIIPIYYARYDARLAQQFSSYINSSEHYTFYIDTCAGGMICPSQDKICEEENKHITSYLKEHARILYQQETEKCMYLLVQT